MKHLHVRWLWQVKPGHCLSMSSHCPSRLLPLPSACISTAFLRRTPRAFPRAMLPPSMWVAGKGTAFRCLLTIFRCGGSGRTFGCCASRVAYSPTRWPESPRIVMRCAPQPSNDRDHLGFNMRCAPRAASNGRNYLGFCATHLQACRCCSGRTATKAASSASRPTTWLVNAANQPQVPPTPTAESTDNTRLNTQTRRPSTRGSTRPSAPRY